MKLSVSSASQHELVLAFIEAASLRCGFAIEVERREKAYVGWIRRFVVFNGRRQPVEMGAAEVEQFLSSLALDGGVSGSTQNQALAAMRLLYRYVLGVDLPWMDGMVRARRPHRFCRLF